MSDKKYQYFKGLFEGFQGQTLTYQSWRPIFCEKVIVFLHGMGEHSGRYYNVINGFANEGFAFYGYDQRGHGMSPGKRGHAPSCHHLAEDLARFLKLVSVHEDDKPIYLYAHSFGGLIALKYLIKLRRKSGVMPDGVILSNPLLKLALEIPTWKKKLAITLSHVLPKLVFNGTLSGKDVSRDPKEIAAYDNDKMVHCKCTTGLYVEMLKAMDYVAENAELVDVPLLMLLSTGDVVVNPEQTRKLFPRFAAKDKVLKIYEGFYHEPHNEIGKEQVISDMKAWLKASEKRQAVV